MDLYVWKFNSNEEKEIIGIVDNATSTIWEENYYSEGQFEIYIEASNEFLTLIQEGYFISRSDTEYTMIIEKIEIKQDVEEGNFIAVTGRSAKSILARRIARYNRSFENVSVEKAITDLLNENAVNPTFYANTRKINCLALGTNSLNITENLTIQVAYENLLSCIQTILKTYESSIKLVFNENTNKFDIKMFTGIDRSYNQNINDVVLFSEEFDNLLASDYVKDLTNAATAIYVGGDDFTEGSDTIETQIVDKYEVPTADSIGVVSGLDRYEVFVNASDLKRTYKDDAGNEIEIEMPNYRSMLQARGKENVILFQEDLNGEIDASSYKYRVDYNLGDVVTIYSNLIGAYKNVRITSVTEVQDEEGYAVKISFE